MRRCGTCFLIIWFGLVSISNAFAKNSAYFDRKSLSEKLISFYSKELTCLNEPSLLETTGNEPEIYRFLFSDAGGTSFMLVRIGQFEDGRYLTVKKFEYHQNKITLDKTRILTIKEWDDFQTLVNKSLFWNLPSEDNKIGLDGSYWLLEGRKSKEYQVISRWQPVDEGFKGLCIYLWKLSGEPFSERYNKK